MASRLYRTTRPLYLQVCRALDQLGAASLGSPTTLLLVALYVTGLVLLDARPTQTRVTRLLPGRCHDALNRLLRTTPLSTRSVMGLLIAWSIRQGAEGYLCLDDVVVEKAFARRLRWAGWTYSFAKKRKVYGMHVVVVLWCSTDGRWRIPVAFRLWRPKRSCAPHHYQAKLQLAAGMLTELVAARLPFAYLVMDTHYTAGWFTRLAGRLGITWVGTLPPRTTVVWHGRRFQVAELAGRLRLRWRTRLGLRAAAVTVYAPKYGTLRLVVTRNRHGNHDWLASSDVAADLTTVVLRKQSRWSVETIFRDTKQYAGLGACQCWTDQAVVRHVALVLVAFVVLQHLRLEPAESVAAVKERWQLTITRHGERPPTPLKACPAHLRATATIVRSCRHPTGSGSIEVCPGPKSACPPRLLLPALEKGAPMPVIIGVDPHKVSHTAAALDDHGQLLDQRHVPATLDGYQQLRQYAVHWPQRCWAVEGAHGVGRALAQRLVGDGEQVADVPAKLAARVRVLSVGHGRKSDPDDAVSVATAARSVPSLRQVGVEDQAVVLHLLTKRRQDLGRVSWMDG